MLADRQPITRAETEEDADPPGGVLGRRQPPRFKIDHDDVLRLAIPVRLRLIAEDGKVQQLGAVARAQQRQHVGGLFQSGDSRLGLPCQPTRADAWLSQVGAVPAASAQSASRAASGLAGARTLTRSRAGPRAAASAGSGAPGAARPRSRTLGVPP